MINYFCSVNSARGYVTYLSNNLEGLRSYLVKGVNFKPVEERILSLWQDDDLELIRNPFVPSGYEAIINRDRGVAAVFDINQGNDIEYEGIFDMYDTLKCEKMCKYIDIIAGLVNDRAQLIDRAYIYLNKALRVHDEWEKIYIKNMNFDKADIIATRLTGLLLKDMNLDKRAEERHRFLGGLTPQGAVDYIDNLTAEVNKRYFIKGRPGTGKSTIMKKIASASLKRGFNTEIYHCGFDPESLDMLIMRELGIAIFDSTAPHEYFPTRESDEIVDVYNEAVKPETDDKNQAELNEIQFRYQSFVSAGKAYLINASALNGEILNYHLSLTDNECLDEFIEKIIDEINAP